MDRRDFLHTGLWAAGTALASRLSLTASAPAAETPAPAPVTGPLRTHPENRRYFADATGGAVYLTGSHTWPNVVDHGPSDPPPKFDFDAYLDFLARYGHNFTRLWTWELMSWDTRGAGESKRHTAQPHPFARTGHRGQASSAPVRTVLSSGSGPLPRHGRHRLGAVDRQAPRRGHGRRGHRREHARPGHDLRVHPAPGQLAAPGRAAGPWHEDVARPSRACHGRGLG